MSAQYAPSEIKEEQITPKNSLGLIFNPVVSVMLGSAPYDMRAGLLFRRIISDNKSIRASASIQFREALYDSQGYVTSIADTSVKMAYLADSYFRTELRGGVEWSDYTEKSDAFYAVELIVGSISRTESSREINYRLLSNTNQNTTSLLGSQLTDSIGFCTKQQSAIIGLAPVMGWRCVFKKKWEFMASFSPEIIFTAPYKTAYCIDNSKFHTMDEASSIEFRLRLLDVALAYHF